LQGIKINTTYKNLELPFLELTFNTDINGCSKSHIHDKLTIIALKDGNIKLHLKDNELILIEKNIAIINPYQIHSASKMDKNSDGLYALYLDKNWIEKLQYDLFKVDGFVPFSTNIIADEKTYQEFIFLCENLILDDICIKKEEQIIQFISKQIIKNCNQLVREEKNILAYDIKSYIDQNIHLNLSLEEISKQFLITPFHLIRIFKQELDLTPYQYILNHKVNLAKELLSKNMSISEVALNVGFNDQSHLYKYFKQIFSISPKEYQDSLIK
jgi:AraC-like DNA-binding protein